MTDLLEEFGGISKVEELCQVYYERLAKDDKMKAKNLDVAELVAIQSSLIAKKLSGTAAATASIHNAHDKYKFSPQEIAYTTEIFLECMQGAVPAALFVQVSRVLVAEDAKVLQGVARSESSLQHTGISKTKDGDTESLNLSEHLGFTLDVEQIQLIRQHLHDIVSAIGSLELTGEIMIENIMAVHPELNTLFSRTPVKVQGFRFVSQVARFIQYLTDVENLESELYALGMRHVSYITVAEGKRHLKKVIASLLKTFGGVLDEAWNNYAAETWTTFLEYLAAHLLGNLAEFSGKISIIKSSWGKITDVSSTEVLTGDKDAEDIDNDLDDDALAKIKRAKVDRARQNHIEKNCEIFGESLFFNLSVMSKELTNMFEHVSAQNLSLEFGLTVGKLVTNVSDPEELNEELYVLSLRHINYGAQRQHFVMFGQAFIVTLRSLLPRDWNRSHEEAWVWLWNICEKYMSDCLDDGRISKRTIDETVVRMKSVNMNVFFDKYVNRLFSNDEVAGFFAKPKGLFRYIVSKALALLTSMHHTPKATCAEIRALGMRHIKYSPPDHLLPLVGLALIYTMSAMLEGFWTEQVEFGWCKAFEYVCRTIARALKNGSSLVCNCILRDSTADLEVTLQQAPRGARCGWMLEVSAIGATLSPLYWCLFDAKIVMLTAMLKDLLVIRADSEDYYLGVQQIFQTHPNFIHNVCLLQPAMLPVFFDGLMWVSQVEGTTRRFIYFVEGIYGNPLMDRFADPHRTPLASMLKVPNLSEVFGHDVVQFVILHKWKGYAHSFFKKSMAPYALQLPLVFMAFLIFAEDSEIVVNEDGSENKVPKYTSFAVRILLTVLASVLFVHIQLRRLYQEVQRDQVFSVTVFGYFTLKLPFFLKKVSNMAQFLVNFCLVISVFLDNWVMGPVYADWFSWEGQDKADRLLTLKRVHHWILSILFVLYFPIVTDCYMLQKNLATLRIQLQILMSELTQVVPFVLMIIMGFSGAMMVMEYPPVVLAGGHWREFEGACARKCDDRRMLSSNHQGTGFNDSFNELGLSAFMEEAADSRRLTVYTNVDPKWKKTDQEFFCDNEACTLYNMKFFDNAGWEMMEAVKAHDKQSFLLEKDEGFTGDHFMDYQTSLFTLMVIGFGNYGVNPYSFSSQGEVFLCLFGMVLVVFFWNILFAGFAAAVYYVYEEIEAFNFHSQASEIIEIETVMALEHRKQFWKSLLFENRVPFSTGDSGLTGGIQLRESVTARRVSPDKVDCIVRHAGAAGAEKPWPILTTDGDQTAEIRLSRLEKHLRKLHKQLREVMKGTKGTGTGTGTGTDHSDG